MQKLVIVVNSDDATKCVVALRAAADHIDELDLVPASWTLRVDNVGVGHGALVDEDFDARDGVRRRDPRRTEVEAE